MGMIKKLIESTLNNTVYVKSLEIGGSYIRDYESSYFIHPKKQVGDLCRVQQGPFMLWSRFEELRITNFTFGRFKTSVTKSKLTHIWRIGLSTQLASLRGHSFCKIDGLDCYSD